MTTNGIYRIQEEENEEKKNEKIVGLCGFFTNITSNDTINPNNIESKLRSISNGNVFYR